ncbi:transmembrane phosphatase with tensin homology [Cricetulus griseus]
MSFPSSGRQSFYRNPIKEVVRFLDTKHPNHYQVYNLCSENSYDPKYFHYRVRRIMIDDHNVPTLEEMLLFSKEVNDWMAQHPENVVAIHCKGGKGRTGTMVCACLIASEIVLNAKESLYFFGERRTDKASSSKFQGVETPSQSLDDDDDDGNDGDDDDDDDDDDDGNDGDDDDDGDDGNDGDDDDDDDGNDGDDDDMIMI